ncbi:hypothetical protein [Aeromicrobium sp. UC242_57]|uniref:hypothetical protein n=1 Tax=Aeromicrobium sp. UC242_57 TaxID=3374624 RepID=UPI00378F54A3
MGLDIEQNYRHDLEHVGGMAPGAADVPLVPDMTTIRRLPWLPRTPVVICDPTLVDGSPLPYAPRQILKSQLQRLESLGVTIQAATELEFYLFDESYEAAWDAGHQGLTASTRHHAAYDAIAAIKAEPFVDEVIRQMDLAGVQTEGYSQEYGFGQQEINLAHTDALEMADRHFLFKFGVKSIAARMGMSASFMAKWAIDGDGSSCHIHTLVGSHGYDTDRGWRSVRRLCRRSGQPPWRRPPCCSHPASTPTADSCRTPSRPPSSR